MRSAQELGFEPLGVPIDLGCNERAVRWRRLGLDYTYVVFSWRKR